MTISIRLFGQLSFEDGEQVLGPRDFGGVKPKQLLELLLRGHGAPVSNTGSPTASGASACRRTSRRHSRRTCRCCGARSVPRPRARRHRAGAYRLALDQVELDVDAFDELLERAQPRARAMRARSSRTRSRWRRAARRSPMSRMPTGLPLFAVTTTGRCWRCWSRRPSRRSRPSTPMRARQSDAALRPRLLP